MLYYNRIIQSKAWFYSLQLIKDLAYFFLAIRLGLHRIWAVGDIPHHCNDYVVTEPLLRSQRADCSGHRHQQPKSIYKLARTSYVTRNCR